MKDSQNVVWQERAEKAEEDARFYRMIFEKSTAPTIVIEADYTISRINERVEELLGYSKEEIEGKIDWLRFAVKEDLERMMRYHHLRRNDPAAAPGEYECRLMNRDGQIHDILIKLDMIRGTTTSVATLVNVTAEKEVVKTLRQREAEFRAIVEHFTGFLYTCHRDYRLAYINGPLGERTGKDANSGPCYEVVYGRTEPCLWCENDEVFSGKTLEVERLDPLDERWYSIVTTPIGGEDGSVLLRQTVMVDITERKMAEERMRSRAALLMEENERLKSSMKDRYRFHGIVGKSPEMQCVYDRILQAAGSGAAVVIRGESGTGKELVAQAIHGLSPRADKPFVPVNCGAIPETLMESEFFGYKKGAFTGAAEDKKGLLEMAGGGTLFLDEVGEIPLSMQVKLLRALEGNGFRPLGGREHVRTDIRIIAATHRNMEGMVAEGRMRQDFFYRLHIIPIHLPALRKRTSDIPLLVEHFLSAMEHDGGLPKLDARIMEAFSKYTWPGNVRELQNVLQRYVTLGSLDLPLMEEGDVNGEMRPGEIQNLKERLFMREREILMETLRRCKGHRGHTAEMLGIDRRTLERKMARYDLRGE
ncbi:sigma 54-interacting transcriptional regulator [Desulfobotulus sp. H1]|uniref:Sigma 54-interacting transcriptional regulator n=1 Tax=Desulfobotulus pelophilus TaxID=2823377 RepID=A0ABT3NA30_9BACT|nr:sigma 54-interacting transcriptional regulator [Desulfobotulus pelophilus]MCW7754309.1 sigma 54-interacting transcriptional regulator [Desulfobotulus pelophilus]